MGRTVHRMPQIGEIERGLWLASGFGGHGLNNTAMAGELVARGIIDGDQKCCACSLLTNWFGLVVCLAAWWHREFTGVRGL